MLFVLIVLVFFLYAVQGRGLATGQHTVNCQHTCTHFMLDDVINHRTVPLWFKSVTISEHASSYMSNQVCDKGELLLKLYQLSDSRNDSMSSSCSRDLNLFS